MNRQSAFTITKLKFSTHIHVCTRGDPVAGPVGQGTECSYGHVRGSVWVTDAWRMQAIYQG